LLGAPGAVDGAPRKLHKVDFVVSLVGSNGCVRLSGYPAAIECSQSIHEWAEGLRIHHNCLYVSVYELQSVIHIAGGDFEDGIASDEDAVGEVSRYPKGDIEPRIRPL